MTMTLGLPLLFPAHRAVRDLTKPLGAWPGILWSHWELFYQNGLLVNLATASPQGGLKKSVGAFPVTSAI